MKSVTPISRLAPGCSIHPIPHFKNVGPPFWFLSPLLLNPGDGPGSHASYHHCGKVINVRETYFCEKTSGGHQSFVCFSKLFQFCTHARIMMGRSQDVFLRKNHGGHYILMSFSKIFQLCTHATVTRNGSKEK